MSLSQSERVLRARLAAHTLHSAVDGRAHTEPARQAFQQRFERQVDPDGVLPEPERQRRAESARKAYYTKLAFESVKARRARRGGDGEPDHATSSTRAHE
jgi:hypothetical protein